MAPHHCL